MNSARHGEDWGVKGLGEYERDGSLDLFEQLDDNALGTFNQV